MSVNTFITESKEDTQRLAARFALDLVGGDCLCLSGDLGSGKTTFTQGVAAAFGIHQVTSPTYVLVGQYEINGQSNIKTLYHLDLYRLQTVEELKSVDINEIFSDPNGIVLIEWPDRLGEALPARRYDLTFKQIEINKREITIKKYES